ncbi:MAG TPA: sigma 54-interacting transcriptional regulator [Woeseiaceae bacterium]|nr:sigma 54-interacting transcriptional regulator [Woeseiaceae bacterium]
MNERPAILLVDDDEDLLQLLTIRLGRAGFQVQTANSAASALRSLAQSQPRAVITDLKMDETDGLALLEEIEKRYPVLPVILLTAHGTIPDAVKATRKGAFAFLTKPINDDELVACLREAIGANGNGNDGGTAAEEWRAGILTRSAAMETVLQQAKLVAATDASVIIESASGTGKELLARAMHAASDRADGAFVPVNCTAIPQDLFESEIFGHVKGSFTGAHRDRTGLIQQAHLGTLFLDEIGDMPMAFQAKLLRALQEKVIRPVGAENDIKVDVRVIAATHRDLQAAIVESTFREDLYYRLSVVRLSLPPLSARREDIPLLTSHFLRQFAADGVATGFSSEAMQRLLAATWPGNVRQLANVIQQCVVLCPSAVIPESLVEHALGGSSRGLTPFATAREEFEFDYLHSLMQATGGNVSQAARLAERNRSEFYKLLKKHSLDPAEFRHDNKDEPE